MSRGSYRGGSSIVGPQGFSAHDDAEDKINKDDLTILGDVENNRTRTYASEKEVLEYIITQWVNLKPMPKLNKNIDPKLREEIRRDPYNWMRRHKLFNEMYDEIKSKNSSK